MATTLWDKFQAAVRWVRDTTDSAVAALLVGPPHQDAHSLLDGQGSATSDPSTGTDGANIEGWRTVQLFYSHNTGGDTSEIKIWLFDGSDWYPDQTVSLDQDKGILDPYDVEGCWERIDAQLTTAPGDTVTVKLFPHNE
jgi:hypothetical protein